MGETVQGTSVLEGTTRTVVEQGVADAGATATDVLSIALPVAISVALLGASLNFVVKKIKGVLAKAS